MKSTVIKKILMTVSALVAMLMIFSITTFAEDYGNFSYTPVESEEEAFEPYNKISGYNAGDDATETVIVIPSEIEEVPVTIISASAFSGKTTITEVVIPDSVTTIENAAFLNCTSLELVVIPDSVTFIGESAFQGCTSLKTVVIGNGVKEIGDLAFKNCSALTQLDLGTSVEAIGNGAFFGCDALAKVYIPDSVQSIGSFAFGFVQDGNNEAFVNGFEFLVNENEVLDTYNALYSTTAEDTTDVAAAFKVTMGVKACDAEAHAVSYETVRVATDSYDGLDLAQCSDCLAILTKANTDVAPVEKSFKDYISLIIIVVAVIALVAYCLIYVKKAKAHREASIAEYKAGKTLSDVELKTKQEAKEDAKYAKKRAKQEKKLEIFK